MALTLCEHACKTVFDVKPGIDPCPSSARSWDKAYQISGCTVARKNSDVAQKVTLLLEQLQVFIFVEIVFGVRCTLKKMIIIQERKVIASFSTNLFPIVVAECRLLGRGIILWIAGFDHVIVSEESNKSSLKHHFQD